MSLALLLGTELTVDVERGHTVFGISAPGPYVERVEALGVTHVPIHNLTRSWSLLSDLKAFVELVRTLRRLKLDVLHTHTPKAAVMGRIAGRLAGVPVVVNTCHGLWARPEDRLMKRLFVHSLEALAARFSHFELFQNAEDAHTMRRFLKPGRWKVVGNGIDLDRFQPDPEGRARIRAEWGIADDQLVVGTIGRRVREKGLAEFAEAAHRLRDQAVFVWVGPEDETDSATEVPHQDAIRFVGEYTDMPAVYSALDVFVLASYREGFSRASMEAAACGLPMVLSDIRGCREIGIDGEHLNLVPPRDPEALATTVSSLLGDAERREQLGASAKTRAREEFDQRSVAQASFEAYRMASGSGYDARAASTTPSRRVPTVLHVLPQDRDRGAQVFAARLRDSLNAAGSQRHLIATLFEGREAAMKAEVRLSVRPGLLKRAGLDPRAVLALRGALNRVAPDVVVAHGGEALKYVVAAGSSAPTVYKRTGLSATELEQPGRRRLYRALSRRVTHIVGVSRDLLDQSSALGVPADRMSLIPNSRDPEVYRPAIGPEPRATPRMLFIAQFEEGKRPGLFLDLVAALRDRGVVCDVAMVGDGPLRAGLSVRARELNVDILGTRTDVPDLLRGADLVVMTSAPGSEGMPGVLIEAGMTALPVVSTFAAGVTDVVANGETGLVVEPGPAELADITDAVSRLLVDADLRSTMGTQARARCVALFSLASTAEAWERLLARLAEPTSTRGTRP
ncbi:glycosyltransferase [Aestuariimicrobium ganziense]|uniref:glycosyltransferase n=1 Tax=Aestuariimicrobium ganziense TaxID=2773677 RepID=UPI0019440FE5|nr:glycosyltransferase [Aestuariimicrobium ganziense]